MKLRTLLENSNFDHIKQVRGGFYENVFKVDDTTLAPKNSEIYTASFSSHDRLGKNDWVLEFCNKYLVSLACEFSEERINSQILKFYQMSEGDH